MAEEGNIVQDGDEVIIPDDNQESDTKPNIPEWNGGYNAAGEKVDEEGNVVLEEPIEEAKGSELEEEAKTDEAKETVEFEKREDDLNQSFETPEVEQEFYKGLSGILADKGLINAGDKPILTEEDFVAQYEEEIKSRLDARTKAVEEYMNQGVDYSAIRKVEQAIAETHSITEDIIKSNPELARDLILGEFQQRGFTEEAATNYYSMFKSAGKDVEEAVKALELRKANLENMKQQEVSKASNKRLADLEEQKNQDKNIIKSIESGEILKRKINAPTQEKLKRTLQTVVGHTDKGEPLNAIMKYKLENPVEFEKNLLYLYTVTDGFDNFTALDRSAESRISKKFKNSISTLSSGKSFTESSSTPSRTPIDMDTVDDILIPE